MKRGATWLLLFACTSSVGWGQLRLVPEPEPALLFGGGVRSVRVCWQNGAERPDEKIITARVLQTSSATTVAIGDFPWKKLRALPGQTLLDSAEFDFPPVRAETAFLIQWLAESNLVIGRTEVLAYPTNLLAELKSMLGEDSLGLLDPRDALEISLQQAGVEFVDLGQRSLDDFAGKLAIIGPFASKSEMRPGLAQAVEALARRGTAVVWIVPTPRPRDSILPSFYLVPAGKSAVVVAQADLVAEFSQNPKSQLNLVQLCKLAMNPMSLALPNFSP